MADPQLNDEMVQALNNTVERLSRVSVPAALEALETRSLFDFMDALGDIVGLHGQMTAAVMTLLHSHHLKAANGDDAEGERIHTEFIKRWEETDSVLINKHLRAFWEWVHDNNPEDRIPFPLLGMPSMHGRPDLDPDDMVAELHDPDDMKTVLEKMVKIREARDN